jgi:hypothetical protein
MPHIILYWERLKVFSLKLGIRQGCPFSPLLFDKVLEILARIIRKDKEIKSLQIGKKEVKLFLFADDIILYIEKSKTASKNCYK